MFIFLLQAFTSSLQPVIFVPGTYASVLQMTGNNLGHQWYCPKSLNNQPLWINEFYFIPPIFNCVAQWLKIYYDPKTDEQVSHPNSKVDIIDFGTPNEESIDRCEIIKDPTKEDEQNMAVHVLSTKFEKIDHDEGVAIHLENC